MPLFPSFASGFALSGALIMAIGAQNLFVLRQGLRREHVGAVVAFCAGSDFLLMMAGVSGVGVILRAIPGLTTGLTLGGVAFLGWYGLAAVRRLAHPAALQAGNGGATATLGKTMRLAAAFTFSMGGPIFFASAWSFWSDFGYAVLLIGLGYAILGWNVDRNRGIVWLGIVAKLFDMIAPPLRWWEGLAHPIVIAPAAIDGLFCLGFVWFLLRRPATGA